MDNNRFFICIRVMNDREIIAVLIAVWAVTEGGQVWSPLQTTTSTKFWGCTRLCISDHLLEQPEWCQHGGTQGRGSHLPKAGTSRAITSGNHSPLAIWCGSAGKWSSQGSQALNAMQSPSEAAAKGPKLSWWAPRIRKFSFHYINWATLWAETTSPCLPTKDKAPAPV